MSGGFTPTESFSIPRANKARVPASILAFLTFGLNDGTAGALIPYIQPYYNVGYAVVSLIFLIQIVGYGITALSGNYLHTKLGRHKFATLGGVLQCLCYSLICWAPPFPVLLVAYLFAGFGSGIFEITLNTFVGQLQHSTALLGILHAAYGLGCAISPIVATRMVAAGLGWNSYYYVLLGWAVVNTITIAVTYHPNFMKQKVEDEELTVPATPRKDTANPNVILSMQAETISLAHRGPLMMVVTNRFCWLVALYLVLYLGLEISTGGWVVEFMIRVRDGAAFEMSYVATGFWLGVTVGRLALGFPAARYGEKRMVLIYTFMALCIQFVFWFVPSVPVSAVSVALIGFFIGPIFPCTIALATKVLPGHLHVSVIGFIAAFGSLGAALIPFSAGVLAQTKGVKTLMPLLVALEAAMLGIWVFVPTKSRLD